MVCTAILAIKIASAVPADPTPRKFTQPNGSVVTIILKGDERIHWAETTDGYTLLPNQKNGWVYAVLDSKGDMVPSKKLAKDPGERSIWQKIFLRKIKKGIFFSKSQIEKMEATSRKYSPLL